MTTDMPWKSATGSGEAILGTDQEGVAQLQLTDAQNQERAYLDAEGTLMISDETGFDILRVADDVTGDAAGVAIGGGKGGGIVRVTDAAGKPAVGILGSKRAVVVVNASGKTVSEMVVNETGSGFFQVWGGGAAPIAVLGRAPESEGGIVQVSNGKVPVASLYASEGGRWAMATDRRRRHAGCRGGFPRLRPGDGSGWSGLQVCAHYHEPAGSRLHRRQD